LIKGSKDSDKKCATLIQKKFFLSAD